MKMTAAEMRRLPIDIPLCLSEIRKVRGFRQDEIADVLGRHVGSYAHLEDSATSLKVCDMIKLCDFYGVTPNQLLGWR